MKRITDALKANSRIDDWKINLHRRESCEMFFIKGELDCVRRTDTTNNRVTVYTDHEGFRGDSMFYVYPSTTDAELEALCADGVKKALLIKNAPYALPEAEEGAYEIDSNFSGFDSLSLAREIGETALSAVEIDNAAINSLEVFVTKHSEEIITSRGLHKTQTRYDAMVEAIPTYNGVDSSVELYEQYNFSSYDPEALKAEIAGKIAEVKARFEAAPPAEMPGCPVVLGAMELWQLFREISFDLDYSNVYSGSNLHKKGDAIQPDGSGDRLCISLVGTLPGSSRSSRFDIDGVSLGSVRVVENGIAANYHGSNRFGRYLGEKPSGILPCMKVEPGTLSPEELGKAPYLELVSLSGLQVELYSDYIGGEVRLAYYHDGEKTVPLTGISVSGKLSEVLASIRLSTVSTVTEGYCGPEKALLSGMKIF